MSKALSILVAAACVCIIAATGYYFISERRASVAEAAAAAAAEAHAKDVRETTEACAKAKLYPSDAPTLFAFCVENGYIIGN